MIDLAALTYVAVAMLAMGGLLGAWSLDPARRMIGALVAVFGLAVLGAAASRWWGSAELEGVALLVFAIVALRASDLHAGEG